MWASARRCRRPFEGIQKPSLASWSKVIPCQVPSKPHSNVIHVLTTAGSYRPLSYDSAAPIRVTAIDSVQQEMIRDCHYAIMSGETEVDVSNATRVFSSALPLLDPIENTTMPEAWVRAQILIRANSLAYPSVGVRPVLLERLTQLLNMDVVPRVPLRGSISGVGDMVYQSYVASVLAGKPSVQAWIGDRIQGGRRLVPADEALTYAEIDPIEVRAKEGMALVIGTSSSSGVSALAVHEAICLAATVQVLSAMAAEALCAADMCFDPILAELRPHQGQSECASNLRSFLEGSKLIMWDSAKEECKQTLCTMSICLEHGSSQPSLF